ncbi:chemotaxis protein CheW [Undibacterium rugosum]|uniref:Purine-binding chemotaxis protein CheW n=1 Tax=Undibacterium rugosum TaxID=2762291 RepID=A0A923KWT9_9BURK|nr:chemotaxis protein CheW [Undibacterium rugosum]MBC3936967.1 purine-binding chemotaxis protein CheW [Undibacterium rugosum]MBR7778023.1 purine-binding chemotaxis protein CheW [Undibacterium rugosum]
MGAITESKNHAVSRHDSDTQGLTGVETAQYLTFMLSGEIYALEILNIKEIIQYGDLTEVPMMPAFIRGVINLRGKVVPVVDMNARFGRGVTTIARRTSIVIIEFNDDEDGTGAHSIGVMVDAVNEVIDIARQDIEPPPAFGARIRTDFVNGMAKHNGRFIIVLNLAQVLSVEEMSALGSAMLGGSPPETQMEAEYER